MSKRSAFRDAAEFAAAWPILKSLETLPLAAALREAEVLAALLRRAAPRLVRVARRNLSLALPELPDPRRESILDGVYQSLARLILTFARFPELTAQNISRWIRYDGFEHYERARAQDRGVLFLTAHLGNWELSAFAHALYGHSMQILVRPLDNRFLDRLVTRYRALGGNRIIEKTDSPRRLFGALHAGESIGVLIDQNASLDAGVFVDFFGVPACASTGLAKIALRTGAPVVPGFALWNAGESRYILRFWPPLEMVSTGDADRDVLANTQTMHTFLESVIRQHPEQWLWIHRRWKTRPPGEPPLY